jgi:hypothetical protein
MFSMVAQMAMLDTEDILQISPPMAEAPVAWGASGPTSRISWSGEVASALGTPYERIRPVAIQQPASLQSLRCLTYWDHVRRPGTPRSRLTSNPIISEARSRHAMDDCNQYNVIRPREPGKLQDIV